MNMEIAANHGPIEAKKEKLVSDIKAVINDADGLLKSVASSAADELSAARGRVENQIGEVKSRLNVARAEATRRACDAAAVAETYCAPARPHRAAGDWVRCELHRSGESAREQKNRNRARERTRRKPGFPDARVGK